MIVEEQNEIFTALEYESGYFSASVTSFTKYLCPLALSHHQNPL